MEQSFPVPEDDIRHSRMKDSGFPQKNHAEADRQPVPPWYCNTSVFLPDTPARECERPALQDTKTGAGRWDGSWGE